MNDLRKTLGRMLFILIYDTATRAKHLSCIIYCLNLDKLHMV